MTDTDQIIGQGNQKEMKSDFYVYVWRRRGGQPFYVGKGRAGRDSVHKSHNIIFTRIIAKMRASGHEPSVERVREGMTEADAFALEISLISEHGRINNRTGILANLTDGGEGTSGYVHSQENRNKISEAGRGRLFSLESRLKIGSTNSNNQRVSGPRKGEYKGVTFDALRVAYCAGMQIEGKKTNLGRYKTQGEAARAYDAAAYALWGSDCYLNFPEELGSSIPNRRGRSEANRLSGPKSGEYKGVHLDGKSGKSWACIRLNGASKHLGIYATQEEAARAYDMAAVDSWGFWNCYLNFPERINDVAPKKKTRSESTRMAGPRSGDYKGVCFEKRNGMYAAAIQNGKKREFLGYHLSQIDAAHAYDAAATRIWGHGNCYLNFPDNAPANDKSVTRETKLA